VRKSSKDQRQDAPISSSFSRVVVKVDTSQMCNQRDGERLLVLFIRMFILGPDYFLGYIIQSLVK